MAGIPIKLKEWRLYKIS